MPSNMSFRVKRSIVPEYPAKLPVRAKRFEESAMAMMLGIIMIIIALAAFVVLCIVSPWD